MEIKKVSFVKDEPITSGKTGYYNFYHKFFSPALKEIVLSDSCPHTIGLFSKWGTGKSSIIDELALDLEKQDVAHVFVFDVWKYQEDSLRRIFLIKLVDFLKNKKGYNISDDVLKGLYVVQSTSIAEEVEKKNTRNERRYR